jgi:hypothetical protein
MTEELKEGRVGKAKDILTSDYPFEPIQSQTRSYTELQSAKLFVRDGFIDRYTGARLVFPAALRLISHLLPEDFPYHRNWKMSETHVAYWELFPTVDHIVPVARGGDDSELNWVSTSMLKNSAKSNWTLEELGWDLHPKGSISEWDGLTGWFLDYVETNPDLLTDNYFSKWQKAALKALEA